MSFSYGRAEGLLERPARVPARSLEEEPWGGRPLSETMLAAPLSSLPFPPPWREEVEISLD